MKILKIKSKYPKTLIVKDETYRIIFVNQFEEENTVGECDPETRQIRILKGMSVKETVCTLIHEIIHALHFEHEFKIKHKTVYALEKAFFQLLVDNFL